MIHSLNMILAVYDSIWSKILLLLLVKENVCWTLRVTLKKTGGSWKKGHWILLQLAIWAGKFCLSSIWTSWRRKNPWEPRMSEALRVVSKVFFFNPNSKNILPIGEYRKRPLRERKMIPNDPWREEASKARRVFESKRKAFGEKIGRNDPWTLDQKVNQIVPFLFIPVRELIISS